MSGDNVPSSRTKFDPAISMTTRRIIVRGPFFAFALSVIGSVAHADVMRLTVNGLVTNVTSGSGDDPTVPLGSSYSAYWDINTAAPEEIGGEGYSFPSVEAFGYAFSSGPQGFFVAAGNTADLANPTGGLEDFVATASVALPGAPILGAYLDLKFLATGILPNRTPAENWSYVFSDSSFQLDPSTLWDSLGMTGSVTSYTVDPLPFVPEPSALMLFSVGVVSLSLLRRRVSTRSIN